MFLTNYIEIDSKEGKKISKLARESCTYNAYYLYWRDELFERVMRLFVWENTYDMKDDKVVGIKPKEIEQRLLLQGHCGITKLKVDGKEEKELTAMFGHYYGVSKYIDDRPYYMVRCPIYSGQRTIGKDIVVIDNNSLKNPTYDLVHHYATMLAHAEVTLVDALVNVRDCGGIPVASTEKQKQSIASYQGKVFNGQYGVVTDIGNLGLQFLGSDRKTHQGIMDIMEIREKLIKSFYSDIGVRSAFEKRNNTVQAEVEADSSLLLLNLSDMIDAREKGAEKVNKMYGTNWTVHVAEEIDYGIENQRIQFDTTTEIHQGGEVNENNA